MDYLNILKNCELFSGLNNEEIASSLKCINATVKDFHKDEYIHHAGDKTDCIGLVLSGTILVVQDDVWGNRNIITKLETTDFFAEPFAVLQNTEMNVSIEAESNCTIMFININNLLNICPSACEHHNKLIKNLVTVLSKKILVFNDKISHMSKRKTRDKILSYLSSQAIKNNSYEFMIPFNRQQLADFLCIERSAMSAEISKLKAEGLIDTNKNHFKLNV